VSQLGKSFWTETVLGGLATVVLGVTLAWPDWLELTLHVDPDAGSGAAEWVVVTVLAAVAIVSFVLARLEWRRAHAALT
jgi:hypothetical protein